MIKIDIDNRHMDQTLSLHFFLFYEMKYILHNVLFTIVLISYLICILGWHPVRYKTTMGRQKKKP